MSRMPGWYQTQKPLQFKAIEEFATNTIGCLPALRPNAMVDVVFIAFPKRRHC